MGPGIMLRPDGLTELTVTMADSLLDEQYGRIFNRPSVKRWLRIKQGRLRAHVSGRHVDCAD